MKCAGAGICAMPSSRSRFAYDVRARSTYASRWPMNVAQSSSPGCTSKPTASAMRCASASSAASHIAFLGTQPRLTQVPPNSCGSNSATFAPCRAARIAVASPPEPPPTTSRSGSFFMRSHTLRNGRGAIFHDPVARHVPAARKFHALLCDEALQQRVERAHELRVTMDFVGAVPVDFAHALLLDVACHDARKRTPHVGGKRMRQSVAMQVQRGHGRMRRPERLLERQVDVDFPVEEECVVGFHAMRSE